MATIKTIAVNYERKLNTGNYSSATVGCTMWADVEVGEDGKPLEDPQSVMTSLWQMAKANVKEQMLPLVKEG